jgi:hypothetical protein
MSYTSFLTPMMIALAAAGPARGADAVRQPASSQPSSQAFQRSAECVTCVYSNNFDEQPAGTEWSEHKVSRTLKGKRPYLGDFLCSEPVSLKLDTLPPHKLVRISFDLFLGRSWDGSSPQYGGTLWDMSLGDARNLIHTSFCNSGFFDDNNEQAFPDTYPARPHPAWTGAVEKHSLGIFQSWGGPDRTYDTSCVYHMVLTFPHSADEILFKFVSTSLRADKKKYFGLTNVRVETLPELRIHTEKEFAGLWKDLGSAHPAQFFPAQWEFIASGEPAAEYIARHLGENIDLTDQQIRHLIENMRELSAAGTDALEVLAMQGRAADGPVSDALADPSLSQDWQQAFNSLIAVNRRFPESPNQLRLARARQALGVIHMPDTKWRQLVRNEVERQITDPAQLDRLKTKFPRLFTDSGPANSVPGR